MITFQHRCRKILRLLWANVNFVLEFCAIESLRGCKYIIVFPGSDILKKKEHWWQKYDEGVTLL